MLKRGLVSLSLVVVLSGVAAAQNAISEWGGAQGGYEIVQGQNRVTIFAPGTYKFQALDPNGPSGLGIINHITVDPNCPTGTVSVYVVRDPNDVSGELHSPGALDLKEIDLSHASASNVSEVVLAGNLGELGPVLAMNAGTLTIGDTVMHGITIAQDITGPLTMDRLVGDLTCNSMRSLYIAQGTRQAPPPNVTIQGSWGDAGDEIVVGGALGELRFETELLGGTITVPEIDSLVAGDVSGEAVGTGNIGALYVALSAGGRLDITGDIGAVYASGVAASAVLDISGAVSTLIASWDEMAGLVSAEQVNFAVFWTPLTGTLQAENGIAHLYLWSAFTGQVLACAGQVYAYIDMRGRIESPGDCQLLLHVGDRAPYCPAVALRGQVVIGGDMQGFIDVTGDLGDPNAPPEDFAGSVIVNGSLKAYPERPDPWIHVDGAVVGASAFISVDYDGWHAGDDWDPIALVTIGDPNDPNNVYRGNTPSRQFWEITECKGDMNNDGIVDVADISPFVLALTNSTSYGLTFPGLAGSRVFHGDLDCDGTVYIDDINPFIQRMTEGCCDPSCGECPGDNAGQPPSAKELAALLAANVDAELYDSLVTLVGENAGQQDNEEDAAYWEAVYYALIE